MQYLIDSVREILQRAACKAFPDVDLGKLEVTLATQEEFGHYQCNSAMRLAKIVKKSPRDIAQAIVDNIECSCFSSVEVAGAGFINVRFSPQYIGSLLDEILIDPRLGVALPSRREKVVVEFSSPNIAKEMHVGHLRSTIIGEALARLFEFLGYEVIRLNHVGDWGTAFGMLIAYMREEIPEALEDNKFTLQELMSWYRASKTRFDNDEEFKIRSRNAVIELQRGDPYAEKAWQLICHISRESFNEIYDLLDVKIEERGESFYNPILPKIVSDLEDKGLITVSEGAKCVFHEGYSIPLMVQKSDGGYNYDTTDMAAIMHRIFIEKADRIIVVTDAGQKLHFDLIRKTAEKVGYLDPKKVKFDHVTFGVVLGSDGKKFRTRSGEVERLYDLLQNAIKEANKILREREPDISEERAQYLSRVLGIAAVKYADLSCNRNSDYVFSYARMLRFEGNTALFILYSYVRVNGIKRKIGEIDVQELISREKIKLEHSAEVDLGLHILRFGETLQLVERELLPSILTDFLYLLAQKFNIFFRDCRVVGDPLQNSRLLLCELVASVMKKGLNILGIQTVDRL